MKRKYTKEDIYDYLLENYGLTWSDFKIYKKASIRKVRESDFVSDQLVATVLLIGGDVRNIIEIAVTNETFNLLGIGPKTDVSWTEFLAQRRANKQGLNR